MAKGDVKSYRGGGGGGRGGGGRSSWSYTTDYSYERGLSKEYFDAVNGSGHPCQYLLNLPMSQFSELHKRTTTITRYGKKDWERIQDLLGDGCKANIDKRVKEMLQWRQEEADRQKKESQARHERYMAEQAVEAAKREQEAYTAKEDIVTNSQMMLGALQSETAEIFTRRDRDNLDTGEFLDDPTAARLLSGGWGETYDRKSGFKLQITCSLDVSNSNWHNGVAPHSIKAFQHLVLAVRAMKQEHPDDINYSAWLFSMNRDGKGVEHLLDYTTDYEYNYDTHASTRVKKEIEDPLKETLKLFGAEKREPHWAGEDSWLSPLFDNIARWEAKQEPGYVKLDIILSDGVFERKVDITAADDIQARRGQTHSVVLNFMNEDEWYEGRLPYQTVQYSVTPDNITGMLRLVMAQFLEAYI